MFNNSYAGKTVLVTGNTGFKGSWLTLWLLKLGAKVVGLSKDIPTDPAMFEILGLDTHVDHHFCDVRNHSDVEKVVLDTQPDFVFHLAAQPIVSLSYEDPLETLTSNAIGTANVLQALRQLSKPCVGIFITSDKCYENVEWEWGYREDDQLGGKDIYSASKAAAEVIFSSYARTFFGGPDTNVRLSSARAGNVIGGGDWAKDRIVVDCVTNWANNNTIKLRSPEATRPWQHVLEPISGYLALGSALANSPDLHCHSFNFGPRAEQNATVLELLKELSKYWPDLVEPAFEVVENRPFNEAGLLKLNCDKAIHHLNWFPTLTYAECVRYVGEWYAAFYSAEKKDIYQLSLDQLTDYEKTAMLAGAAWST